MTETRLKPCPIPTCGKPARSIVDIDQNPTLAQCSDGGCDMATYSLPIKCWQALPRPSKAARKIARELMATVVDVGAEQREEWAARLKQIAEPRECPDHPEAICGECAECEQHKELTTCFTCYSRASRTSAEGTGRDALRDCVDALDRLMGDSDLADDDSPEFRACQRASILLQRAPIHGAEGSVTTWG